MEPIIKEQSAMAVVILKDTILSTREDIYGNIVLSLPKGHIEVGEAVIDTAIREAYEETNIQLTAQNFVSHLSSYDIQFKNLQDEIICKKISPVLFTVKEEGTLLAKEQRIKEVCFLPIKQFLRECSYENVKSVVEEAIGILNLE